MERGVVGAKPQLFNKGSLSLLMGWGALKVREVARGEVSSSARREKKFEEFYLTPARWVVDLPQ